MDCAKSFEAWATAKQKADDVMKEAKVPTVYTARKDKEPISERNKRIKDAQAKEEKDVENAKKSKEVEEARKTEADYKPLCKCDYLSRYIELYRIIWSHMTGYRPELSNMGQ